MERCVAAASHHGCGICTCLHVFRLPLKGTGGRRTTGMYGLGAPGYIDARWPNCRMSNALTCPEVKSPSDYGGCRSHKRTVHVRGKAVWRFLVLVSEMDVGRAVCAQSVQARRLALPSRVSVIYTKDDNLTRPMDTHDRLHLNVSAPRGPADQGNTLRGSEHRSAGGGEPIL